MRGVCLRWVLVGRCTHTAPIHRSALGAPNSRRHPDIQANAGTPRPARAHATALQRAPAPPAGASTRPRQPPTKAIPARRQRSSASHGAALRRSAAPMVTYVATRSRAGRLLAHVQRAGWHAHAPPGAHACLRKCAHACVHLFRRVRYGCRMRRTLENTDSVDRYIEWKKSERQWDGPSRVQDRALCHPREPDSSPIRTARARMTCHAQSSATQPCSIPRAHVARVEERAPLPPPACGCVRHAVVWAWVCG